MAYVRVDNDRTWVAEEGLHHCPQLIQIVTTDTPYVQFDFSNVIAKDNAIDTAVSATVIEKDSKTITIADASISPDGKKVSFKVSGMAAGDFVMRCTVQMNDGTTNTISRQGTIRVS